MERTSEQAACRIVLERHLGGPFRSIEAAYDRLALTRDQHESLAKAGAYGDQARREALFTLTTLANARPGGKQGLLASVSTTPACSFGLPGRMGCSSALRAYCRA